MWRSRFRVMGVEVLRLRGLYRLSFWGVFRVYSVCGFVLESLGLIVFFWGGLTFMGHRSWG